MRHWLFAFRPETYPIVQQHGLLGVNTSHRRRFAELCAGDPIIAYVSRKRLLDGYGTLTSDPFEDTTRIFGSRLYPHRCNVSFERVNARAPEGDLLWVLDAWKRWGELKTTPWNMMFCLGGFVQLSQDDYDMLREEIEKTR